jgi:hypothetical protein
MFLPVLLLRDFGLLGYAAFAIPNVLGAAAMGWVLRDGVSEQLTLAHRPAILAFTAVTIAFQAFFAGWMSSWVLPGPFEPLVIAGVLVALALTSSGLNTRLSPALAGIAWLASAGVLLAGVLRGELHAPTLSPLRPGREVLPLALVCVLGFLTCPYLDVTFHAARQQLGHHAARRAFTLGFGFFFASMILGTLGYATLLGPLAAGTATASAYACALLVLHIGLQLLMTIRLHSELWARPHTDLPPPTLLWPLVLGLLLGFAAAIAGPAERLAGLSGGELIYRVFMAFYGLVFPAYALIAMLPTRGSPIAPPTPALLRRLALAVAIALPFYTLGFIHRQTWFLAPGVAVVLVFALTRRRVDVRPS